jgi:nucleoside 2-deoxyribosyltransferase
LAKTSAPPKVYLAGPDVFLRKAMDFGVRKVAICARHGLDGVFPLSNGPQEIDLAGLGPAEQAFAIAQGCETLMLTCDAAIANLTPFRGVGMDPGTAFEVGFMRAQGKPVFGYTNSQHLHADRVRKAMGGELKNRRGKNPAFIFEDDMKMGVEDFGLAENLMLEGAIHHSGGSVIAGRTKRCDRFVDLVAFEACVQQAAAVLLK